VNLPSKMVKLTSPESPTLLDGAAGSQVNSGISGFGAPLGRFVPLFVRLKRTGPDTVHFTVTIDNVTYLRIEEDGSNQPHKIDVLSIYFPEQWRDAKVTLAPLSAAKSLLKPALYYSNDAGKHWHLGAIDVDGVSPATFHAPEDGEYWRTIWRRGR